MEFVNAIREAGLSPVNTLIGSASELYKLPYKTSCKLKGQVIAENFKHHYENNDFYRDACTKKGVTPEDVKGFDDLNKIPLIPVGTFKQCDSHLLLTSNMTDIEFEMRSTGTSGIPSVSRRDVKTMDNASDGIIKLYREFFQASRGMGLFLFPPTEEMPEMGMVKVLNVFAGLFDGSVNLVKKVSFNPQEAVERLNNWEGMHTRHIVGPPFLIHRLLKYLMDNNIKLKLDNKSFIVTLGGWKRFTGQQISREEFNNRCEEYLGVKQCNVRDMYGLVEANMLAIECDQHKKHMPPWVHISIRNPKNVLEEVKPGERGVIAIFDPTSTSYPGFILTEDVGYIHTDMSCTCGRSGQMLHYISRLPGVEVGCCAINLEKYIEENEERMKKMAGELEHV
ncbi:LuxE family acyl-protein synthetase [Alkalihalophilus lindianensis]|uniref:LuxE family acyl-protein synthetase n=1 Tax=Alkalihalophilus lindianensis TaxID=1630542 RepID=A0ABU3X801_9BACI|nr:LuxE family acyl-protein synthetase [Alkalihalophilus lindianensis]MDV2684025.1 LuxE family acyl-protein synthetase [Alkalihalophilus lindianensis]